MQQAFTFDYDRFNSTLIEAIEKKQAVFRDGVAYWKKGLEQKGIIQHLPLKPIEMVTNNQFLSSMESIQATINSTQAALESAIVLTQAVSTASLMLATVIQTQILTKKIEQVQQCVLEVAHDIKEQNTVFYMDKASEYLGVLQNFKVLLNSRVNINNVDILANQTLSSSIQTKNHLISFISNILSLINLGEIKNQHHEQLILQFIQQMMEILPFGMHCEFILSHRLNHMDFSQILIEESNIQYAELLEQYRFYLNKINNGLKGLVIKPEDVPYFEQIKAPAKKLINSSMIDEFLRKPALEHIAY